MVKIGGATLEEVSPYFHLPIEAAAKELGVCSSALKRRCRRLGIKRWPFRKVRSMSMSMARNMEDLCGAGAAGVMPSFLQPQAASRLAAQVAATSFAQRKKNNPRISCTQLCQTSNGAKMDQTGGGHSTSASFQSAPFSPSPRVASDEFINEASMTFSSVQRTEISNHEGISWENVKSEEIEFCPQQDPIKAPPKPRSVRPSVPLQHLTCPSPFSAVSGASSFNVSLVNIPNYFSPAASKLLPGSGSTPQSCSVLSPRSNSFQSFANSRGPVAQHFSSASTKSMYSPRVFLSPRVFGEEIFRRNSYVDSRGQVEVTGDCVMSPHTQSMFHGFGLLDTPKAEEYNHDNLGQTLDEGREFDGYTEGGILDSLALDPPLLSPVSRELMALISASPLPSPPHLCSLEPDTEDQLPLPSFTELLTMEVDSLSLPSFDPYYEQQSSSLSHLPQQEPQSPFSWLKIPPANETKVEDPYDSLLLSPGPWQWRSYPPETDLSNTAELLDPSTRSLFLWPLGSPVGLHLNIRPTKFQNQNEY